MKRRKRLLVMILVAAFCLAALGAASFAGGQTSSGHKYLLAFSDDFDGRIEDGWGTVAGGSSYSFEADGRQVRGWRFGGEDHIAYKTENTADYGKFLYGDAEETDYVFEVKMKADVGYESLGQYMDTYGADPGAGMTINTHLPFYVTDPLASSANRHEFLGRSVCISNYAIGFYQKGAFGWGWAQSVRLNAKMDASFDWRQWHTIRVEATPQICRLWLDGVLMLETAQSVFTKSPQAAGPCGFTAVCSESYDPLRFDDFRFWRADPAYDPTVTQPVTVDRIDAADFVTPGKVDHVGGVFADNMRVDAETNRVIYNDDPGTDNRLLNAYEFGDFSAAIAFDLDNQQATASKKEIRTSIESGFLFGQQPFVGSKLTGYSLAYYGIKTNPQGNTVNTVSLRLRKYVNGASSDVKIFPTITGTSSCVAALSVAGDTVTVTAYKSQADYESDTAVFTESAQLAAYAPGRIGMRINAGTTQNFIYQAAFLAFSAETQVAPPACQPVEESAEQTVTVVASGNGRVTLNGAAVGSAQVPTHSDVRVQVIPDEGHIVDGVTVNGVAMGAVTGVLLQNVTKAYRVEASFTTIKTVDVYLMAGQSNAAGFTPISGLYKGYTYGGAVDAEKLAEYENGYPDVLYYGVTQSAEPESLDTGLSFVSAGKGHTGSHIGPELGLAASLSGYYGGENGKAAVIKYAVGATSLGNFQNATSDTFGTWMPPSMIEEYGRENLCPNAGLLYENLLVTVREGLVALSAAGYRPRLKGVTWMQGEADATQDYLAKTYAKHLSALITDLRADLSDLTERALGERQDCGALPFVIGKIGADLRNAAYEDTVREQMQMTAAGLEAVRCAETGDLAVPDEQDNNDVWHFSAKGILAVGERFGDLLAQETGRKPPVTHTVTFADPYGTPPAPQTVKHWMTAAEPTAPAHDGYTFLGWFAAGKTQPWRFTAQAVDADLTLAARYQEASYSVDYHLNGGRFDETPADSYTPAEGLTLAVPQKDGYTFGGWYASADLSGQPVTAIAAGSTGDKAFYAKWTAEAVLFDVTVVQPEHGAIAVSSDRAEENTVILVTVTPDEGWQVARIQVNGKEIEGDRFVLHADSTVEVQLEPVPRSGGCGATVASAGGGGILMILGAFGMLALGKKPKRKELL